MADFGMALKAFSKRFRLLVAGVVFLGLIVALWLCNLLFEDIVLTKVKEASVQHHWEISTNLLYLLTTYPTGSAVIITCVFLICSEAHNKVRLHPIWTAIFGQGEQVPFVAESKLAKSERANKPTLGTEAYPEQNADVRTTSPRSFGDALHLRVGQPVHIPLPLPKDVKPGDKFEFKLVVHGPDKVSVRDSVLLVADSVLEFVVRREKGAPPYPSLVDSEVWAQQQAIFRAYDAETMRLFRQAHSKSVEGAHLKLLLKGFQDPALDRLFNDPGTTVGIKTVGQKLRDLTERLPQEEDEGEKSAVHLRA